MMPIKAIVFDADGTLMNSFDFIVRSYVHLATVFGYPAPTAAEVQAHLKLAEPLPQIMQSFCPGHPVSDLMREYEKFLNEHMHTASSFDGTRELLAGLHAAGLQLAILTGGNAKIEDVMRHHGFSDYFASIMHCDRVQFGKPHPEGFMLAAAECGVAPAQTIMVGDSPNDILAGKNGGAAATIGITHGHASHSELQAADPDYIVHSVPELKKLLSRLVSPA